MCTPANTPATPPNFPETLLQFSKLSTNSSEPALHRTYSNSSQQSPISTNGNCLHTSSASRLGAHNLRPSGTPINIINTASHMAPQ